MAAETLRARALKAIDDTRFVPPQGEKRITGMVETRPDWVVSRQRAWGVPITVFVHKETGEVIPRQGFNASAELIDRIVMRLRDRRRRCLVQGRRQASAFSTASWTTRTTGRRSTTFSTSGSIPAAPTPSCWRSGPISNGRPTSISKAPTSIAAGSSPRCWKSCGTRGRAPFDAVVTHGFVVDEDGRKMSKSLGNVVAPQDVIRQSGAEILRLWAMSSDYAEDLRIGPDIIKANVDSYRRLRNTLRFLLGNLAHYRGRASTVAYAEMPELERYMLARLAELDALVREGYAAYDFKRIFHALLNFCVNDLSAFYLDIRKDALYCDAYDSVHAPRRAHRARTACSPRSPPGSRPCSASPWRRRGSTASPTTKARCICANSPTCRSEWRDEALAEKWRKVRQVRRVVTGALEIERKEGRIGSSLEAAPKVYVVDEDLRAALDGVDLAEIAITSGATLDPGEGPRDAFRLEDVEGVAVVFARAKGRKCARSWKILAEVGIRPRFPTLSPRDAAAVRQFDARAKARA